MNIQIERLFALIKESNTNAKNVEIGAGIAQGSFSSWKKGKCNPSMKALSKLAEFFDVPLDYLLGRTDERQNAKTPKIDNLYPAGDFFPVPIIGSVRAGVGGVAEQEQIGTDFVAKSLSHGFNPADLFFLVVKGDSMYPRIADGDHALVHKQTSVDSGSLAVVLVDDEEAVIKKVYYGADWIELVSLNPNYPPRKFVGKDVERVFVVGRVLSVTQNWA